VKGLSVGVPYLLVYHQEMKLIVADCCPAAKCVLTLPLTTLSANYGNTKIGVVVIYVTIHSVE
jgi:hypothetical protein